SFRRRTLSRSCTKAKNAPVPTGASILGGLLRVSSSLLGCVIGSLLGSSLSSLLGLLLGLGLGLFSLLGLAVSLLLGLGFSLRSRCLGRILQVVASVPSVDAGLEF